MKALFTLAILSFNLSAMANEITCSGQNTKASIELDTRKVVVLESGNYTYDGKIVPISGNEFGIKSNQSGVNEVNEVLTYKFKTLKKHPLAKKNSTLVLTITQKSNGGDGISFILNETYDAELRIEKNESGTVLDKMTCK